MRANRAMILVVLKSLATSRSTYSLIGLVLVLSGFAAGSKLMAAVATTLCVVLGGCGP